MDAILGYKKNLKGDTDTRQQAQWPFNEAA